MKMLESGDTILCGDEVVELVDLTVDVDCKTNHSSSESESSSDSDSDDERDQFQENDAAIVQRLTKCIPKAAHKAKTPSPRKPMEKLNRASIFAKFKDPLSPPVKSYSRDSKNRLWPSLTDFYRAVLSLTCTLEASQSRLGKRGRGNSFQGVPQSRAPDLNLEWYLRRRPEIRTIPTTFNR